MTTPLESIWEVLARQHERPVFRRIDEVHPLDFYVGVDFENERVLMLLCDSEPPAPLLFEALQVVKSRRADGRWILAIRLNRRELVAQFSRLCGDIVEQTRGSSQPDGPAAVITHLARWKRLMQLSQSGLSDSEARGLIGELLLLESILLPKFGTTAAIKGWTGPSDAPQDFRLPGLAIEVKTCETGSNKISVSSLDQLDGMGNRLLLVINPLSAAAVDDAQAITLAKLVERVRDSIRDDPSALEDFDSRLEQVGFSDADKAASVSYRPGHAYAFEVTPEFPRLTRAVVPQGMLAATYVLDLGHCQNFRCDIGVISHGD